MHSHLLIIVFYYNISHNLLLGTVVKMIFLLFLAKYIKYLVESMLF